MEILAPEILMTRTGSVAEAIERLLGEAEHSIQAALYRFNLPRLWAALDAAGKRGVRVRLVLDRNKFAESHSARELFSNGSLPFRLSSGRPGAAGKMHHKFVVIDGKTVLTGSYNWTIESEEQNFENLAVLRDSRTVALYQREFDSLWAEATPAVT